MIIKRNRFATFFLCTSLLCTGFSLSVQAEELLVSDWSRSRLGALQSLFVISGTNGRNNVLRQQLQKPFQGKELYVSFNLKYEAETLDTSQEDEGEFFILWADDEEGEDTSAHNNVPTFGIHVEKTTGENRFMVRYSSRKEIYTTKQVQGDQTYFVVGRVSRSNEEAGSPYDTVELWIDPKPIDENSPDASITGKPADPTVLKWIGFTTGGKTEPTDRIQVSGLSAVASWEEVFGITPIPEMEKSRQTKTEISLPETVNFRKDIYPILKSNCFDCHSGSEAESGIRLDDFDELLNHVTPQSSKGSHLVDLVITDDERKRMPPVDSGYELTSNEIEKIQTWIDEGPRWDHKLLPTIQLKTDHWAFQPIKRPDVPEVSNTAKVRTPVDAFVIAQLQKLGLETAQPATDETLIRRLSLDLLGLPPLEEYTPGVTQLRKKLLGTDETTRGQLIDQWIEKLLSSQQYGERWGRHWLDVARWAESNGHQHNRLRPHAWRYRDYVIESFRKNKPFDQFLREQIAGDQLEYSDERTIATGFLAAARYSGNELDKEIQRNDILVDIANTTASAFLGLTMECAQCHTHKFDPLTIRDYYQFQAFFTKGQPGNVILGADNKELQSIIDFRWKIFDSVHYRLVKDRRERDYPEPILVLPKTVLGRMQGRERQLFNELESQINQQPQTWGWYSDTPIDFKPFLSTHEMRWPLEHGREHLNELKSHILIRGDVKTKGPVVDPKWPAVFGAVPESDEPDRVQLANWMTSKENPLTARVWVNRIWQWHFGTGLVETSADFGTQGTPPTHPELLDWLAIEFIESGWDTNHIHKLIVFSNTFRQSSEFSETNFAIDPENRNLWRWKLHRLDSDAIRDSILAVTGQLNLEVSGPSVPLSESEHSFRRSLYLAQRRDNLPEQQMLFDSPDFVRSCSRRSVSTAPLQSLYLLNSEFMQQSAITFASAIQRRGLTRREEIQLAVQTVFGRSATAEEIEKATEFLKRSTFEELCLALMNTNEFVYLP